MPKENTHLWFAHGLLEDIPDQKMTKEISSHIGLFHLGSFIPDTFFYSSDKSVERISEVIHGQEGRPTNATIISVIDEAGGMEDIVFILGYITHCALDITFHPMVDGLSGDYYDEDPLKREKAMYLHRLIETCIDIMIGNHLRIYRLTRPGMLKGLAFERIISRNFSVSSGQIESTLSRQLFMNRMFTSTPAYQIAKLLHGVGILKSRPLLALFYKDVRDPGSCIPSPIVYRDRSADAERVETLKGMFGVARAMALPMMEAAWGYAHGTLSREQLTDSIPGRNLSTGELPVNPLN